MRIGVDVIGVGVGAFILNQENQLFLIKRGLGARNEIGYWALPGGEVGFDEFMVDALKRELKEEFSMEIVVITHITTSDHMLPMEKQHWVTPTYLARHISGEPRINEPSKCSGFGWFCLDNIPSPVSFLVEEVITEYRGKFHNESSITSS